jgi:hypothetical protein
MSESEQQAEANEQVEDLELTDEHTASISGGQKYDAFLKIEVV